MEAARRDRMRRNSGPRKGAISAQSGIIIGVATVAGLGLVGKLLSTLRRKSEQKEPVDTDVAALEEVVNGDPAKSATLQAQVQRSKLANLENDEPNHGSEPSKFADSFSEEIHDEDVLEDGELYVNQEPVEHSKKGAQPGDRAGVKDMDSLASVGFQKKALQSKSKGTGGVHIKGVPQSAESVGSLANGLSEKENRKEIKSTSDNAGEASSSTQKKFRRTSSRNSKPGRKSKAGGSGKSNDPLHSLPEGENGEKSVASTSGMWESVNGYKVLKAASSGLENHEAFVNNDAETDELGRAREELLETLKAQHIWDGKTMRSGEIEDAEAFLQIKSLVVSSISDAEETPEGVRVREVVRRSTLLPVPAGEDVSVHSSVYNVEETDEGLKVEETVTRTKLLPPRGEGDFSFSDQQLLGNKNKSARQKRAMHMLSLLPWVVALLIAFLSALIVIWQRKKIYIPHFHFFH